MEHFVSYKQFTDNLLIKVTRKSVLCLLQNTKSYFEKCISGFASILGMGLFQGLPGYTLV